MRITSNQTGALALLALILGISALLALGGVRPAGAASTWWVRADGSDTLCNGTANHGVVLQPNCAFRTLQQANNMASGGDLVRVGPGLYTGSGSLVVHITKSLTFMGANASASPTHGGLRLSESIIDGEGVREGVYINADNVVFDGFTVRNGVGPLNVSNVATGFRSGWKIRNNILENGEGGIGDASCVVDGCAIEWNLIRNNNGIGPTTGIGIYFDEVTNDLTIRHNEIHGHTNTSIDARGTGVGFHELLKITDNDMYNNGTGTRLVGVFDGEFLRNRTVSSPAATGLTLSTGNVNILIANNFFAGNLRGVRVTNFGDYFPYDSNTNITIKENSFASNSDFGLGVVDPFLLGSIASGTVVAERNWWGSVTGPGGIGPGSGSPVYDHRIVSAIDVLPWLCLGTDTDLATPGFQPNLAFTATTGTPCDATPPQTSITSAPADDTNNNDVTITYAASDPPFSSGIAEFVCTLNATPMVCPTSGTATFVDLPDGTYLFRVAAKDNDGNIDPTRATVLFRVDTVAPAVTSGMSPAPNGAGWNTGPVTMTFGCLDNGGGSGIGPGGNTFPASKTVTRSGTSTYTLDPDWECTDRAGNTAAAPAGFPKVIKIDAGKPTCKVQFNTTSVPAGTTKSVVLTTTSRDSISGVASTVLTGVRRVVGTTTVTPVSLTGLTLGGSIPQTGSFTGIAGSSWIADYLVTDVAGNTATCTGKLRTIP